MKRLIPAVLMALAACAGHSTRPEGWSMARSDLAPDPAFHIGHLANGMRTITRTNATPAGTASIRLDFATGSLDERANQRGFAHFVEHMAFDGSDHVPEGEMIRLLERDGLAFGPDTNAHTGFEHTTYEFDLPRNDPALLDTALMLLREVASGLTFAPGAVARERGVVLAELRDGEGYQLAAAHDQANFLYPGATYRQRFPIGVPETLRAARPGDLAAFWRRHYVPQNATLIVVGDFPGDVVDRAIAAHFADWRSGRPAPRPDQGKVARARKGVTDIWIDPALSERMTASRHGPWRDEPDTVAQRRQNLLRQIGYAVINRRFERMSRAPDPPFRGAGFGTSTVFHIGRTTNMVVDSEDGCWRRGLIAATRTLRQSLHEGFTPEEIAEQVANIRTALQNGAAASTTRANRALVATAMALVEDDKVPTTPESALARFNAFADVITPGAVLAALTDDAVPLDAPMIRFQGRRAPDGGAPALRAAWNSAQGPGSGDTYAPIRGPFSYTDFGTPGQIVTDSREPSLGIRRVVFANGVRVNLRRTDVARDRISLTLSLDGGDMLASRADPLAVDMVGTIPAGGLGRHSADDIQTLLAGHSVSGGLAADGDIFATSVTTTPRDLTLQLDYLAALVTDPGWRHEAEVVFRENVAHYFARADATPHDALARAMGGIVSDNDPRFSVQPPEAYQALTFARLKATIGDRLAHGAIEIGLVGDLDEDATLAAIGRTFGALPAREPEFRSYVAERRRSFTARRGPFVVRHKGVRDQAILRLVWPTTDAGDPTTDITLDLLQDVVRLAVRDTVRGQLGKAYSPGATADQSEVWTGWGTFAIEAGVDPADLAATRTAILATLDRLRNVGPDADLMARARAPLRERHANALKGNGGWLALVAQAQSHPERIARFLAAPARIDALSPGDIRAAARRWLDPAGAVEIVVLPEGAAVPALP